MTEIVTTQRGGGAAADAAQSNVSTESRVAASALTDAERERIDKLFAAPNKVNNASLYYHLSRVGPKGLEETDALSEDLPRPLIDNLKTIWK